MVQRYSGWPGQWLSSWRNFLMSSSETDGVAEALVLGVDGLHVRSGAASNRAASRHGRPRARSGRDWARSGRAGSKRRIVLPERVSHRRQRHRRAGMARVGRLHGVHGQRADRVDAQGSRSGVPLIAPSPGSRWSIYSACGRVNRWLASRRVAVAIAPIVTDFREMARSRRGQV